LKSTQCWYQKEVINNHFTLCQGYVTNTNKLLDTLATILKEGKLGKKLADKFGSYEDWGKDFRATAAMRGIGWTTLYQDNLTGRLINQWINEHETGHLAGCTPILVLDVFEHAFMLDYGLKRPDYIEAFFKNIDWGAVEAR